MTVMKGQDLSVPGALEHTTKRQIPFPGPHGVKDGAGEMSASSFLLWSQGIRKV